MYVGRLPLFVGIGILFLPLSLLLTLAQGTLYGASLFGTRNEGEGGGILVLGAIVLGTALTLLVLGFVQAATARALVELDAGRRVTPLRAYRLSIDTVGRLLGAIPLVAVAVSVLGSSGILLPVALWLAVRWSLVAPVVELEGRSGGDALGRSAALVRRGW